MKTLKIFVVALFLVGLLLTFCEGATAQEREPFEYDYFIKFRIGSRRVTSVNFFVKTISDRLDFSRIYDLTPPEDGWKVVVWTITEDIKRIQVFNVLYPPPFIPTVYVPEEVVLLKMTSFDRVRPPSELIEVYAVEFVIDERYSIWLDKPAEVLNYPLPEPKKIFLPVIFGGEN